MAAYVSRIITSVTGINIESFSATHNRGYTPNTAELTIVTKKTEPCPFTLGTEYIFYAKAESEPGVGSQSEAFRGYHYQTRWEETADSTHKRWYVSFIDALGEIESYDVDIKPTGEGTDALQDFYKTTLPAAYFGATIESFSFQGNGLQGLREYDAYRGYCPYGGDGDEVGSAFDRSSGYIRVVSGGDSLPGSYAVKVRAPFTDPSGAAEEVSVTYSTASQQWWIPFAAKNDDNTKIFVLFMTYVKHAQVYVEEGSINQLYFDDTNTAFDVFAQSFYEEKMLANDLSALGLTFSATLNPFFIIPEDDDIFLTLVIPWRAESLTEIEIDTNPDAINIQPEEAIASLLLTAFKYTLPNYITLHILSQSAEQIHEVIIGDEAEADVIDMPQILDLDALNAVANHEYNERIYNTETTCTYEHGMLGSIPLAVHFPTSESAHTYQGANCVLERTEINYDLSSGVIVTLTFKEKSNSSGTMKVFPGNILYRKIAESYANAPSIITNIEYCWIDRVTGKTKIRWKDDTISEYSQNEIEIGENGVLLWKAPLTKKEKFNYL
jgi:hypothetical protein